MKELIQRYALAPGAWVLDGWSGTGSTTIAALRSGLNSFMFDIDKECISHSRLRIQAEVLKLDSWEKELCLNESELQETLEMNNTWNNILLNRGLEKKNAEKKRKSVDGADSVGDDEDEDDDEIEDTTDPFGKINLFQLTLFAIIEYPQTCC